MISEARDQQEPVESLNPPNTFRRVHGDEIHSKTISIPSPLRLRREDNLILEVDLKGLYAIICISRTRSRNDDRM